MEQLSNSSPSVNKRREVVKHLESAPSERLICSVWNLEIKCPNLFSNTISPVTLVFVEFKSVLMSIDDSIHMSYQSYTGGQSYNFGKNIDEVITSPCKYDEVIALS
jgi:hypothetical protein